MASPLLWICYQFFLLILHNKRNQEIHQNFISCFLRKCLIWSNLIFLFYFNLIIFLIFDWASKAHYSLVLLRCFQWVQRSSTRLLWVKQSGYDFFHDCYWILKQSGHDFSGKRLCDGYCTKILCDVYVWRVIQFCEKASLGIFYVILFEYKGP